MELTIAIIHYRDKQKADKCIRSMLAFPPLCSFSILFIDNGSHDGSIEYIREKWGKEKKVVIMANTNVGFGAACNMAIQQTKSPYICFMNPDIEVQENTLASLFQYLQRNKKVGIVGPQLLYENGTIQDSYRQFPRIRDLIIKRTPLMKIAYFKNKMRGYLLWDKDVTKTEAVDWLVGGFWMARRDALDKTILFDKRYFLFFEDVDLCRQVWNAGYEVVYVADAKAWHHHVRLSRGGIMDIFRKKALREHIKSAVKYFWKWRHAKQENRSI